ncbi:MAG: DNA polymerase III subunit delta' [Thiohalomonadales bacterium]
MIALQLFPWTHVLFNDLFATQQRSKLPHALLISGIEGLGKLDVMQQFSRLLLCQHPTHANSNHLTQDSGTQLGCGTCHACNLFSAGHHPDFLTIEPEKKGGNILVDQIRRLNEFVSLKSHLGGMQVIIINHAHRMNRNAANSLLKTLEEPTDNVLLILISSKANALPATIKSRCQRRVLKTPSRADATQWLTTKYNNEPQSPETMLSALQLSSGAPLLALDYLKEGVVEQYYGQLSHFLALSENKISVVEVASKWAAAEGAHAFLWLLHWVSRLIGFKFRLANAATHHNGKTEQQLQNLSMAVDLVKLYHYYDQLLVAIRLSDSQVNKQLLLEKLLINWRQTCIKA